MIAATELRLFIDNDASLDRQMATSIRKNLITKKARGIYQHGLAVKGFGYLVEAGAKKYAKDFGGTWHQMFDVPTRRAVAEELTRSFEGEAELGNYDYLLPKKYQQQSKKVPAHLSREIAETLRAKKIAGRWQPIDGAGKILRSTIYNADGTGYATRAGAVEAAEYMALAKAFR